MPLIVNGIQLGKIIVLFEVFYLVVHMEQQFFSHLRVHKILIKRFDPIERGGKLRVVFTGGNEFIAFVHQSDELLLELLVEVISYGATLLRLARKGDCGEMSAARYRAGAERE